VFKVPFPKARGQETPPTSHTDFKLGLPITEEDVPSLATWGVTMTVEGVMGYVVQRDNTVRTYVPKSSTWWALDTPPLEQGTPPQDLLREWLRGSLSPRDPDGTGYEHLPPAMRSLMAQEAVLQGNQQHLDVYRTQVLGLNSSWNDAVSTGLLSEWADPLRKRGELGPEAQKVLTHDIRTAHRHMLPLWERRTYGGHRVLLLDKPYGANITLQDLVADERYTDATSLESVPEDPRLAAIFNALEPAERKVFLARGLPGIATWTEAAAFVGAANPDRFGRHVRRKIHRHVAERQRRDTLRSAATQKGETA
jgi:hypothetical protein